MCSTCWQSNTIKFIKTTKENERERERGRERARARESESVKIDDYEQWAHVMSVIELRKKSLHTHPLSSGDHRESERGSRGFGDERDRARKLRRHTGQISPLAYS